MAKKQFFTQEQKLIFDLVKTDPYFEPNYYFTGGTALSYIYLHHRYSEDLDFFTERNFDKDRIYARMKEFGDKNKFEFSADFREVVYIFLLKFENGTELKVDFGHYPHQRVGQATRYQGFEIDSLIDIAVNKLMTINQRSNVKDFVDLYYLLKKFTVWDLIEGLRIKFRMKTEPIFLASDYLKVNDFTELPSMIKPLSLEKLKSFFRKQAKKLAQEVVE